MNTTQKIGILVITILILSTGILFWNRAKISPVSMENEKLFVLTTFMPIYSFTAQVAGDDAVVENLLPAGAGPHEYSFRPSDIARVSNADVIVKNGLGLEDWMSDLIQTANPNIHVITASEDIETLTSGNVQLDDPHIWLDPVRAQMMVENIARGLGEADPDNASSYNLRAEKYLDTLSELDRDMQNSFSSLFDKRFVGFHGAFQYVADRYGLEQVAVIEPFPGKEPSLRYLIEVVDLINEKNVIALFSEPQFSPKVVETVAHETGLEIHELDSLETGDFTPDSYENKMRQNLKSFLAAFE